MHALSGMNGTIGAIFETLETRMQTISWEAANTLMRDGDDVVDGPRHEPMKSVRAILSPSCEFLRVVLTIEFCRLCEEMKKAIL